MTPICGYLGLLLLLPATALGAEHRHQLGSSESIDTMAKRYYGATWKVVYLLARNNLGSEDAVKSGDHLVVPAAWLYRVRRGDSLAGIAKRFLGGQERYKAIMQFNSLKSTTDLAAGSNLLMPFHLRHVIKKGETYSQVSRLYYRTTRLAELLAEYNGNAELHPGRSVVVPIFDKATLDVGSRAYKPGSTTPKAQPAHKPENSPEKRPVVPPARSPPTPNPRAKAQLAQAKDDYRQGLFTKACPALLALLDQGGWREGAEAQLVRYLGFCAVAAGDGLAAKDYFRLWLALEPRARLSPVTTSPKILAVFEDAAEDARQESKTGND